MKKITILLAAILYLCFSLAACTTAYEDTNGADDFTLQTITDENIIHLETGSSGLNYTEEHLGDIIHSSSYSAKNFNGTAHQSAKNVPVNGFPLRGSCHRR